MRTKTAGRVKALKAVADISRLKALTLIKEKPIKVGAMKKKLKIENTLLSHHLKILKVAGLVVSKRYGKTVQYKLSPIGNTVMKAVSKM